MQGRPLAGISVLVADDDVDSAEMLGMLLSGCGANVSLAHTGRAAIELLGSLTPDVLLLDITLPDMDGYELLGEIRGIPGMEHVAAVAVTGHAGERDRAKAIAAGFAVHTSKPIDAEALVHLMASLAAPASPATRMPTVTDLEGILTRDGVVGVLRVLNARTPFRYTALYRYDGPRLRSVALVDRLEPTTTNGGEVAVETTLCWIVQRDRASFATNDASKDDRVAGLPLRDDVQAYCGTLVRNADGTPFGSICHFDHVSHAVSDAEIVLLEQFAPVLARVVAPEVF